MDTIEFFHYNKDTRWCKNQINKITSKNPKDIFKFTSSGKFLNDKYIDTDFANELFNLIPDGIKTKHKLIRANNAIMTGTYKIGQSFGLHLDTSLYCTEKEKSTHTLLIYLNDDFEGGETEFFNDDFKSIKTYNPRECYALLFDMKLWHLGRPINKGIKHWLHIEIITEHCPCSIHCHCAYANPAIPVITLNTL